MIYNMIIIFSLVIFIPNGLLIFLFHLKLLLILPILFKYSNFYQNEIILPNDLSFSLPVFFKIFIAILTIFQIVIKKMIIASSVVRRIIVLI